jgi:Flp pilus assembly protein TadG
MWFKFNSDAKRGIRAERGGVAVEFAIILPVLMLLVFGIIDFGHAWYMRHLMSDASREGARYGTRYQTVTGNTTQRLLPTALSPSISDYILKTAAENGGTSGWGLKSLLPADADATATPTGPATTETSGTKLAGEDLTVTVNATKTWFVLGSIIPGFGSSKQLTVSTTMKCE